MKKQFIIQYVLTTIILFAMVYIWEFNIEEPLTTGQESIAEHWEYVFTVTVFGMLALIIPTVDTVIVWNKFQRSQGEIKRLKGILPICMYCKKIKDDKGAWDKLEQYIEEHSEADFTHGICPDCFKRQLEEVKQIKGA